MFLKNYLYLILFVFIGIGLNSCTNDNYEPTISKTTDFLTDVNPATGSYTYFSFKSGTVVASTEAKTSNWDFAIKFTTFIVNSGVSGPGAAGVIVKDGVFDAITEAPESGYLIDQTGNFAIKDGEWYDYNPVTHVFAPKAGKVFVFKTATGKFAKMEILSATPTDSNGNVVVPPTVPTKIKYAIRYAYQDLDTRKF